MAGFDSVPLARRLAISRSDSVPMCNDADAITAVMESCAVIAGSHELEVKRGAPPFEIPLRGAHDRGRAAEVSACSIVSLGLRVRDAPKRNLRLGCDQAGK